jgi:hypothetical protein
VKHPGRITAIIAAGAAVLALTACGGVEITTSPAPPAQQAQQYMKAHPAGNVPGMTTGIVITANDEGFYGAAATYAGCPASLTAYIQPAMGNEPGCGAWNGTLETAAGGMLYFTCGSITAVQACPVMETGSNGYIPAAGDYIRVTDSGIVTRNANVQVIEEFAVGGIIPTSDPGPGGSWISQAPAPATTS